MILFILCCLQEVEQLRQEKLEIDQQLRSIHGTTMGSMQNLPMTRRNDRGYNSDMDGGTIRGGGRGSMRGRGRGSRGGPARNSEPRYSNTGSNTISDYVNAKTGSVNGRGRGHSEMNGRGKSTSGNRRGDRK